MKIIHLISGGDVGGAKTHVLSLLHGLMQTETVQLICFMDGPFAQEARELQIPTEIIQERSPMAACKRLVRKIQEGQFEVIHCHGARANMMGAMLRKRTGIPVVTTVHSDYRLDYLGRPLHRLTFGSINTVALRFLDYYIGVSDPIAQMLISRGFDPQRMFSIYNGIDFTKEMPVADRSAMLKKVGLTENENTVVFGIAARISPVKDMKTLIRAFARAVKECPDIRLLIAGDGEQAEEIKALAKELCPAGTVAFLGWVNDVDSFYGALDVNLLTSKSETFPYALTEGARMHCATIASNVGGVPVLIDDGLSGLLFEPGDHAMLARHMVRLARDRKLLEKMSNNLYEKALRQFSITATVEHQKEIYRTILRRCERKNLKRDGVLICGAYGKGNAGDDAILWSLMNQLKDIDPDIPIYALSRRPKQTQMRYRIGACHTFNFVKFQRIMHRTRLYISGGGTLIQDATSSRSLYYYLQNIRWACKSGNQVMMYGCGIGPVLRRRNRRRVGKYLNRYVHLITLRDDTCAKELEALGVTRPEIHVTADPALLVQAAPKEIGENLILTGEMNNDNLQQLLPDELDAGRRYAMFVPRPWPGFEKRVDDFARAAERVYEKHNMVPAFFALEPGRDLQAIAQIRSRMHCPSLVIPTPNSDGAIISVIQRMSCVISMRLHALVFAVGLGVPMVGVVYDPKVNGFLNYLNSGNYIDLQDVTAEKLTELIDGALQNETGNQARVQELLALAQKNETYAKRLLEH